MRGTATPPRSNYSRTLRVPLALATFVRSGATAPPYDIFITAWVGRTPMSTTATTQNFRPVALWRRALSITTCSCVASGRTTAPTSLGMKAKPGQARTSGCAGYAVANRTGPNFYLIVLN